MYFVATALLVTGCLLFASDHVRRGRKTEKSATMLDALLVGVGQALATCPGISRSGTTITAGCFVGFDRKFAVRYSFLMSIPAILGAQPQRCPGGEHPLDGGARLPGGGCGFRGSGLRLHPPYQTGGGQGEVWMFRLLLLAGRHCYPGSDSDSKVILTRQNS